MFCGPWVGALEFMAAEIKSEFMAEILGMDLVALFLN